NKPRQHRVCGTLVVVENGDYFATIGKWGGSPSTRDGNRKICARLAATVRGCVSSSTRTREFASHVVRTGAGVSSMGSARRDSRRLFRGRSQRRTIRLA